MSATPQVIVHQDAEVLAQAAAARLITRLVDVQSELSARDAAHVVLTGGTVGIKTLAAVAASPARSAVDWARVHLWWGDERFLPTGHPDRNETQAREALLDAVPLDPARVHPMPASDTVEDVRAAADRYGSALRAARRPIDVLLLGIGPDGHTASLFPGNPALYDDHPVVAVKGAPKPPPTRLTLTFGAINAATEVWMVASGTEKARAVGLALGGAGRLQVPAAGVHGRQRTLWLLDEPAAADIARGVVTR
jgi:6-phosphogluconolactonase